MTGQPPSTPRHVPERTCVACRRKRPQAEFRQFVRVGGVWGAASRPRMGRGAYVCADSSACWQEKRLRRAFGAQAPAVSTLLLPEPEVSPSEIPEIHPARLQDARGPHRR